MHIVLVSRRKELLIDTREKGKIVQDLLNSCKAELRTLGAGDYYIPMENGGVVIERMTYIDFCGKIMSGRLWKQIEKCRAQSSIVYIILENIHTMKFTKLHGSSYLGALLAMVKMGLRVVHSRNMGETIHIIKKLYATYECGRKIEYSETRIKMKGMDPRQSAIFMLMGIEGIGEKTATKLLAGRTFLNYLTYLESIGDDKKSKMEKRIWEIVTMP